MHPSLSLTETSPVQSFTEVLAVSDVKEFLNLTPDATDDDALIETYIPAAREIAEIYQGRDLIRKQFDMALDSFFNDDSWTGLWGRNLPGYYDLGVIFLREKLVSVDLVQYRDSDGNFHTLTENVDYLVDAKKQPGLVMPTFNRTWPQFTPWPSSAVLIRFTAGLSPTEAWWNDSGARVLLGMKQLCAHWFIERTPIEIVRGSVEEYPFTITQNLSFGGNPRVR
jgi:Phage QLRG family, putative DNA packaging.